MAKRKRTKKPVVKETLMEEQVIERPKRWYDYLKKGKTESEKKENRKTWRSILFALILFILLQVVRSVVSVPIFNTPHYFVVTVAVSYFFFLYLVKKGD